MAWGLFPTDPRSGGDKYYVLAKGTYKVGRKGCDIIINNDKGVSRVHAEINFDSVASFKPSRKKTQIKIKDCSKYGTSVKNEFETRLKVQESLNKEANLNDGDVVVFGTGAAAYRLCFVPLVFSICCSEALQENYLIRDKISSIGGCVIDNISRECTHVLVDPKLDIISENVLDAVIAKKPMVSISWIELLAGKTVCNEIPSFNQFAPSVEVEGASIQIVDPTRREKCLSGYTFVLEPRHEYMLGDKLQYLLEVSAAKAVSADGFHSSSQDSEYGESNHMICLIPKGASDNFGRFKKLSSLNRVSEMNLICAVLSGKLNSSVLMSPSVVVSSSCSTDETVVADSDAEVETVTSVQAIGTRDSTGVAMKSEVAVKTDASILNDDTCGWTTKEGASDRFEVSKKRNFGYVRSVSSCRVEGHESESKKGETREVVESGSDIMNFGGVLTSRSGEATVQELNTSDIIYSQDLIVGVSMRPFVSNAGDGVVNFKRFRKKNSQQGNSFSSLIPFSKLPYKESETGEMWDYMQEEKKKKRMEAIAEDLFNNEKGRTRGTVGSLHRYLGRGL